jgi:serine/threonine protein kinase
MNTISFIDVDKKNYLLELQDDLGYGKYGSLHKGIIPSVPKLGQIYVQEIDDKIISIITDINTNKKYLITKSLFNVNSLTDVKLNNVSYNDENQDQILFTDMGINYNVTLGERLGAGSFGVAYLATRQNLSDNSTDTVVVKRINVKPENIEEFKTEIVNLQKLKPRDDVLSYLHALQDEKNRLGFIITKYIKGQIGLDKFIDIYREKRQFIPADILIKIMYNITNGIKYVHENNIIHRDIKPANTLIDPNTFDTTIIDFGLSCILRQTCNRMGIGAGSGIFMAPEIYINFKDIEMPLWHVCDDQYLYLSDIFSLGITFYELANLQFPSEYDLLRLHKDKNPISSSMYQGSLNPEINDGINNIINGMIVFNKFKRLRLGTVLGELVKLKQKL